MTTRSLAERSTHPVGTPAVETPRGASNGAVAGKSIPRVNISLFFGFSGTKLVTKMSEWFDKYGDVLEVRAEIPLRLFCFRHPEHIKTIYAQKATCLTKPPNWIPRADWLMGNGTFNELGSSEWKRKRELVDPMFTRKVSLQSDRLVAECVQDMLSRWERREDPGAPLDINREMRRLVVDFSFRLLFGQALGEQIDDLTNTTHFAEKMFGVQLPPPWIPTLRNLRFWREGKQLQKLFDDAIAATSRAAADAPCVTKQLLQTTDPHLGRPWTPKEVRDECFSIFFGAHAMSNPLTWTFYLLSRHSAVLRKLQEELQQVLQGRTATGADLPRLEYAEMVLNESMRLYPPFWGSLRFSADPIEMDGYRFPAKSTFLPVRYFAHRHPDYWDNPDGFDPERFAPQNRDKFHAVAFLPYGAGPRACLGRHMAPMVCQLVIAMVMQRFELHFRPQHPNDPLASFDFGTLPPDTVLMNLKPRQS